MPRRTRSVVEAARSILERREKNANSVFGPRTARSPRRALLSGAFGPRSGAFDPRTAREERERHGAFSILERREKDANGAFGPRTARSPSLGPLLEPGGAPSVCLFSFLPFP
jgi:hypothetical protein